MGMQREQAAGPAMDEARTQGKDEAIVELAHVAGCLLDRLTEVDAELPGIFREAIRNKIDYYASRA